MSLEKATFGAGCFWGVEAAFRQIPGVAATRVGYTGGHVENPTYELVCSHSTGHAEAVEVTYDPERVSYDDLLRVFWEHHDPTQGMRQGNDVGTQYRSTVFTTSPEQLAAAQASAAAYQPALAASGYGTITTEIAPAGPFYYAEGYHQQYLAPTKNPHGYRCHSATGVPFPEKTA